MAWYFSHYLISFRLEGKKKENAIFLTIWHVSSEMFNNRFIISIQETMIYRLSLILGKITMALDTIRIGEMAGLHKRIKFSYVL